jgi:hypothetical protein
MYSGFLHNSVSPPVGLIPFSSNIDLGIKVNISYIFIQLLNATWSLFFLISHFKQLPDRYAFFHINSFFSIFQELMYRQ